MDRKAQSREIVKAIRNVLLSDWDPIGIKDEPNAQDEYDGYVSGVHQLRASGATAVQRAEYLRNIEATKMGIGEGAIDQLLPVAEKLLRLDVGSHGGTDT